ncbi:uncharacterized protein znf518a [Menidia menidia]
MESVDTCAAPSTGDSKRCVSKKTRSVHKRLHLRKTAVQPPAMQNEDKNGPKKIAEEWEQTVVWPLSKKPRQEAQQSRPVTDDGGNTLRFTCSQCKDNSEYAQRDLAKHYEEKHRGTPPVFSCHMCTFSTHEFSYLQVHLLSHEDTFPSCSLCNDNVQRTWPEFSAHLTMHHCPNGKYSCEICCKFSTGEVAVFLEHVFGHNLVLDDADDPSLLKKDKSQPLRCQYCGFEAAHKWVITKHIKAAHLCPNGSQRKKTREVQSIAIKSNDPIPRMNSRLTRSAVREMCWLTQDCLSLPGREFLDKYCHLSNPQTTLEETQQFLMKSVTGETNDQTWTKALKSVLSNVPQDMSLHPKSDNGIMSNPSDLAVLTVKNQITVAQNGATYAKRLRTVTPTDRGSVCPESTAGDPPCAADQIVRDSNSKEPSPCLQAENRINNGGELSAQSESSQCTGRQENRENHKVATDEGTEGRDGTADCGGSHLTSDLKSANKGEEKTPARRVLPRSRRRSRRRKRKARIKKPSKAKGDFLKIVLKKNPVMGKQWVSQSPLSPTKDGPPNPSVAGDQTIQTPQNPPRETSPENGTNGSVTDPPEAITSCLQLEPVKESALSCSGVPKEPGRAAENQTGDRHGALEETRDDAERPPLVLQTEADRRRLTVEASRTNPKDAASGEEPPRLQRFHSGAGCPTTDGQKSPSANNEVPPPDGKSPPVLKAAATPEGKRNRGDSGLEPSSQQSTPNVEDACSHPDPPSSVRSPVQEEPAAASLSRPQQAPKHQERTLKLVAINPSQLVKRPAGDQPVVVLNHPDADIPQVARIMEVVKRHREVRRVVLSRRTLDALAALNGEAGEASGGRHPVQERFTLKLKLRRLSRKKYEIVGAVSADGDFESKIPCWYCGRAFMSQETMMAHQQRHLMEWKRPSCENS